MSSIVSNIHFRDLNKQVSFFRPSETVVWAKIIAYPALTYWTADSVGFVIRTPDDLLTSDDWATWWFVWGGTNYYWYQYWIVRDEMTSGQFVFVEGRSPSITYTQISLSELEPYNSDDEAAAAGILVGKFYKAGPEHDRADTGSITSRLA